ncbi:MAG: bifunctional glycosyltransferase family 2/GtrA family protein [Lachnospiraceae bacterium]|nr:bifunctional glycosyltransferase family 2/GtrA family protein [Lachnospiraceae bacterium]
MEYKKIALVPAYEPGTILLDVLTQLKKADMEIVLVNDGSNSLYSDLFEKASSLAKVITYRINRGKGAALKTGMTYIQKIYGQNCIVVTVDADGQHRAEDAVKLCHIAQQHPDALVMGSRKLEEHVPLRSQFGNTVTRFVYQISTGVKIHDTQTGLRAFSALLLPELLSIPGERYEYEMNVLLEFSRRHIPILEHEIETIYLDHNASSHFHAMRDSFLIYKEILKFSASSFVGFLVDYAMYSLLLLLTSNLLFANIGARIVSSILNYSLNRQFVFQSKENIVKSTLQYFLLAVAILLGNTILLGLFVSSLGINKMVAKLLTEFLFFFVSWSVQRFIIFKKKRR